MTEHAGLDVGQQIRALQLITRTLTAHGASAVQSVPTVRDPFLGLPGAASTHDARLAALNLLEDAIAARRAAERETRGRERAEQSARESEEFFRRALQDAPIPVIMHTEDGSVLEVSRVWAELSGHGPAEGGSLLDWLSRACGSEAAAIGRRVMAIFRSPHTPLQTEIQLTTATGDRRRWMLSWTASNQLRNGQPCAIGMALDITERALAEEALRHNEERQQHARRSLEERVAERTRDLATANAALEAELEERRATNAHIRTLVQRLVNIQEEERRSIARDIHDHVGQQMTALRLSVELMLNATRSAPDIGLEASRVLRLSQELDRSIDFLTWQLRPPTIDNLPLEPSLCQLAHDWAGRFGFTIPVVHQRWVPLQFSPEVQTHIYRMVQEALHNAYKHAAATAVHIELALHDRMARIVVRDNGAGFDAAGLNGGATRVGLGLIGIRERATLFGGLAVIESAPGQGTSVHIHVPLAASIWPG